VLLHNLHLLPVSDQGHGQALELACGLGGNALLLAQQGLEVHAWDISPVAIERLNNRAAAQGLQIQAEVRDVEFAPPQPESLDVIVVSYFLERSLFPSLIAALKPNGLLFYQTFIRDKVNACGPSSPDYLLATNELLQLCAPLQVLYYREEGKVGDVSKGVRDVAMLVGMKPC
jgi:SAM-dependent methyltransferase